MTDAPNFHARLQLAARGPEVAEVGPEPLRVSLVDAAPVWRQGALCALAVVWRADTPADPTVALLALTDGHLDDLQWAADRGWAADEIDLRWTAAGASPLPLSLRTSPHWPQTRIRTASSALAA